jgi:uncharacterized membrane protein
MSNPQQPYQPYQQPYSPPPAQGRWGTSTLANLGGEVMAGLAYVIAIVPFVGLIGQIILFAMEKNRFVKFHAAQALCISVVAFVLGIVDWVVTIGTSIGAASGSSAASAGSLGLAFVFGCAFFIIGLVILGFWIWGMIAAFTGKPTKLPIVGSIAEGLAGGPVSAI